MCLYGISETTTSSLISLAGLLNIVLFFVASKAMKSFGPLTPFLAGTVMRFGGALGLGVLLVVAPMNKSRYGSEDTLACTRP